MMFSCSTTLCRAPPDIYINMTSINEIMFRVTGPLCGKFTVHRWIPSQRPVTRSFDDFFYLRLNTRMSKQSRHRLFERPSRSFWRHCNVTYWLLCQCRIDLLSFSRELSLTAFLRYLPDTLLNGTSPLYHKVSGPGECQCAEMCAAFVHLWREMDIFLHSSYCTWKKYLNARTPNSLSVRTVQIWGSGK